MYKPDGHPDVSIYIMASDAEAVITFAKDVFGAEELFRLARGDSSIMHSEIKIGDSLIMLSQATEDYPAFPIWLHVYVPDVDDTYANALRRGATPVQEPLKKEDCDKRGGVMDPAGNTWWIATKVE